MANKEVVEERTETQELSRGSLRLRLLVAVPLILLGLVLLYAGIFAAVPPEVRVPLVIGGLVLVGVFATVASGVLHFNLGGSPQGDVQTGAQFPQTKKIRVVRQERLPKHGEKPPKHGPSPSEPPPGSRSSRGDASGSGGGG